MAKDRLVEFLAVQTTSSASSFFDMGSMETSTVGCDKEILMGPFSQKEHKSGIGVVLRDNQGSVLASLSRQLYSPLEIKAMAAS